MSLILRCVGLPLAWLFLFAASCLAQEAGSEEDKNALRALGARYEKAINEANLSSLSDVVLPGASAVFMTGDEIKGLPAMQQFLERIKAQLGNGAQYTIKLVPDDTDFHGDTAVAHGTSEESVVLGSGRSLRYTTRWTGVLRKVDGQWMAARLHVSLDPIHNPIVDFRIKTQSWLTGGAALVLGLVLGWVVGRRRRGEARVGSVS
jgi:uncharacterized protein (TIGR02246 family)